MVPRRNKKLSTGSRTQNHSEWIVFPGELRRQTPREVGYRYISNMQPYVISSPRIGFRASGISQSVSLPRCLCISSVVAVTLKCNSKSVSTRDFPSKQFTVCESSEGRKVESERMSGESRSYGWRVDDSGGGGGGAYSVFRPIRLAHSSHWSTD